MPAVSALGEPPVALVNVAFRLTAEVDEELVTVTGAKPAVPMTPAVRMLVEVTNASLSEVLPTMTVIAVVPANAVDTLTMARSTYHFVGELPRVRVTVSDEPGLGIAVDERTIAHFAI